MGFNKVYNCLVDVFPQVDQRILKAVAIENSKDADAAVEVVLTEILPALPVKTVMSASPSNGTTPLIQLNEQAKHVRKEDVSRGKQVSECDASSSSTEYIKSRENVVDTSVTNNAFDAESFVAPQVPLVSTFHAMYLTQKDASGDTQSDELILLGKSKESCTEASTNGISIVKLNKYGHEAAFPFQANNTNEINVVGTQDKILGNTVGTASKNGLSLLVDGVNDTSNHDFWGYDQPADMCGTQATASGSIVQVDDVVHQSVALTSDSGLHVDQVSSNEMENMENTLDLDVEATRSSEICRIDILEEIIEDAKNNKKTLLLAMQSVLNMVAEVELQEKAAEKAKEEAARAGLDTLSKVQELVLILTHAKEANDMHAGEIYGEKAILATEAKELQSRLITLSEERDSSLAILDEMRKTLEERRIAAEEARKAAEQEMLEKEDSARKVLAEKEAMMKRVVKESKLIQQEVEENAKLRDFLMDRGQIVDLLQGEIVVICEDVMLLKEKLDQRLPLSKSISSSQTSCILASSGSSLRNTSSDVVVEQQSAAGKSSRAPSLSGQSTDSESGDGFRVEHKDLILIENGLDSWDMVENEAEIL